MAIFFGALPILSLLASDGLQLISTLAVWHTDSYGNRLLERCSWTLRPGSRTVAHLQH